ncbi:MAG: hypothetical protein Q9P01_00990 [Anaerolineae bacterium]|nr:hypothetical protein [Anaerolineae bacterium]MDQ7033441.1 hypothetical protein [Anaerolineae bacterium]
MIAKTVLLYRWQSASNILNRNDTKHIKGFFGVDIRGAEDEDAGEILAQAIIKTMKDTAMPNGLRSEANCPMRIINKASNNWRQNSPSRCRNSQFIR